MDKLIGYFSVVPRRNAAKPGEDVVVVGEFGDVFDRSLYSGNSRMPICICCAGLSLSKPSGRMAIYYDHSRAGMTLDSSVK